MIRAKRIQSDIKELNASYRSLNIHYSVLTEDYGAALIYGPAESPYEFYPLLFHVSFPPTYPFKPPVLRYCGGMERIHPLLEAGEPIKIEGWSASFRLSSALMAVYGLLQMDPLRFDCAYSIVDTSMNTNYNEFIAYSGRKFAERCLEGGGPKAIAGPFMEIIRAKYEDQDPGPQKKWDVLPYAMVCDKRP